MRGIRGGERERAGGFGVGVRRAGLVSCVRQFFAPFFLVRFLLRFFVFLDKKKLYQEDEKARNGPKKPSRKMQGSKKRSRRGGRLVPLLASCKVPRRFFGPFFAESLFRAVKKTDGTKQAKKQRTDQKNVTELATKQEAGQALARGGGPPRVHIRRPVCPASRIPRIPHTPDTTHLTCPTSADTTHLTCPHTRRSTLRGAATRGDSHEALT